MTTAESLPRPALIAATSAALAGLGIAAALVRIARFNYELGRAHVRVAPHGTD